MPTAKELKYGRIIGEFVIGILSNDRGMYCKKYIELLEQLGKDRRIKKDTEQDFDLELDDHKLRKEDSSTK